MAQNTPLPLKLIIGILAITPFFKGLFPLAYQLPVASLLLLGFILFLWRRRPVDDVVIMDFAVLGLAGLYLLSVVWGVNTRQAIQEALKYASYAAIYWITSRAIRNPEDQGWTLRATGLVLAGLAVGSVFLVSDVVHFADSLSFNRISGPYQYPNALAGVMAVGIPLAASLRASAEDLRTRFVWNAALYSTVLVFLFTYSRIAWVIAPGVILMLLMLAPRGQRQTVATGLLISLMATAAVFVPLDGELRSGTSMLIGVWFSIGLAASLALEYAFHRLQGWQYRRVVFYAAVVCVLAIGVVLLPKTAVLLDRFAGISVTDDSVIMRYWTYKDALRGWWAEGAVLGLGGGGWSSIYLTYRSMDVISKLVHSSLLETLTEVGIQGAALLTLIWGLGFRGAYLLRKEQAAPALQVVWGGAIAGLAGLLIHSLFDFDLWYPAIHLLVFVLLGVFRSGFVRPATPQGPSNRLPTVRYAAMVIAGLLFLVTIPLTASAWAYHRTDGLLQKGEYAEALSLLERASRLDPLNAEVKAAHGDLLMNLALAGAPVDVARIAPLLERAVILDSRNPDYRFLLANYYRAMEDHTGALHQLELALELDPFTPTTYHRVLRQLFWMIPLSVDAGQNDLVPEYLNRARLVLERYDNAKNWRPEGIPDKWLFPKSDPQIDLYRTEYLAFSGDITAARDLANLYRRHPRQENKEWALFWLAVLDLKAGNRQGYEAARNELVELNPASEQLVANTHQQLLKLLNGK